MAKKAAAARKTAGTRKAAGTRKTARTRTRTTEADTAPKPPAVPVGDETPEQARARQEKAEADRVKAAGKVREPIPVQPNPPEQPKMIPAKQVEGASSQALDPEVQPHQRINPDDAIRVQAKAQGYYGDILRRVGDVFDIADETAFSDKWMRRVPDDTPTVVTTPNAALEKEKKGQEPNRTVPEPRTQSDESVLGE